MYATNSPSSNVKSPTLHALSIFALLVFVVTLALSIVLRVEIVARGIGKVIPDSRVQIVQAEFGGRVSGIHVRNGDELHAGDIVIELDKTEAMRSVFDIKSERTRLQVENIRLNALKRVFDVGTDAEDILRQYEAETRLNGLNEVVFNEQLVLLQSELEEMTDISQQFSARVQLTNSAISVAEVRVSRLQNAIEVENERHEVASKLFETGTTSRTTYLVALQRLNELSDQLVVVEKELEQRKSEWIFSKRELKALKSSRLSNIARRTNEIFARLNELDHMLSVAERRLSSMSIRAPVDGVVDKLEIFTIGAVVGDREELLSVVPVQSMPVVEVVFSNVDVGFLEPGQKANIKLDAFPSERFGLVEGKLHHVSADAVEVATGQWGFAAQILPRETFLTTGTEVHEMKPGMTATVDVVTGDRSLISYFFAPILKTISNSMGER